MKNKAITLDSITVEDARRAAVAINDFMATRWTDKTSPWCGARVQTLGAFHGVNCVGERRTLWLADIWNNVSLGKLLFVKDGQGCLRLNSGEYYFVSSDLYPELAPTKGGEV